MTRDDACMVAATIKKQLGGRSFQVMTGARDFIFSEDGTLSFKFPLCRKWNYCAITLNEKDLYDIRFCKVVRFDVRNERIISDAYCDQLQSIFTQETGLATHL